MKAIVAVDENWAIGKDNQLLFNIKEDLKRFKDITMNKVVIMGRKTFESLPNKKPLPNRDNYILTRDKNYTVEGATVIHSYDDFLDNHIHKYHTNDIYVIGGSEIYDLFLDYIDEAYVTKVKDTVDGADRFFPNLDESADWDLVACSDTLADENNLKFVYTIYSKN